MPEKSELEKKIEYSLRDAELASGEIAFNRIYGTIKQNGR